VADLTLWRDLIMAAVTGVVALSGVALGSSLNARAARELERERLAMAPVTHGREKIWEHRREAYSTIIGKMHLFVKEADELVECFTDGEMEPMAFYLSPGWHDHRRLVTDAFKETRNRFDETRLIISPEFEARYIQMRTEIYELDDENDPVINAMDSAKSAQSAYDDLLAIAKREITPVFPDQARARSTARAG
jgi:hypothetical protein